MSIVLVIVAPLIGLAVLLLLERIERGLPETERAGVRPGPVSSQRAVTWQREGERHPAVRQVVEGARRARIPRGAAGADWLGQSTAMVAHRHAREPAVHPHAVKPDLVAPPAPVHSSTF